MTTNKAGLPPLMPVGLVDGDARPGFIFNSQVEDRGPLNLPAYTTTDLKNEPMLFNMSLRDAYAWGAGRITREILLCLPPDWHRPDVVVDSRVHMLMPGWFPCIPGWHHDDVPRHPGAPELGRIDGQPNYRNPAYHSEHLIVLINGDICPTEFALGRGWFPEVPPDQLTYKAWHPLVETRIEAGDLQRWACPSNHMVQFDAHTWHQGTRATKGGWRFFIRFSRNTERALRVTNEVRRQVQVYLDNPYEGW